MKGGFLLLIQKLTSNANFKYHWLAFVEKATDPTVDSDDLVGGLNSLKGSLEHGCGSLESLHRK
jgi:hypothetical protein